MNGLLQQIRLEKSAKLSAGRIFYFLEKLMLVFQQGNESNNEHTKA